MPAPAPALVLMSVSTSCPLIVTPGAKIPEAPSMTPVPRAWAERDGRDCAAAGPPARAARARAAVMICFIWLRSPMGDRDGERSLAVGELALGGVVEEVEADGDGAAADGA